MLFANWSMFYHSALKHKKSKIQNITTKDIFKPFFRDKKYKNLIILVFFPHTVVFRSNHLLVPIINLKFSPPSLDLYTFDSKDTA